MDSTVFLKINKYSTAFELLVLTSEKLALTEQNNTDAMFVFLSDVWLDEPEVQARLRKLFAGKRLELLHIEDCKLKNKKCDKRKIALRIPTLQKYTWTYILKKILNNLSK